MESNVIPLHRCGRCGAAGTPRVLTHQGEPVTAFTGCQACVAKTVATVERVRPIFEAMLAAGIDRDAANDAMTFLMQRAGL